MIPPQLFPDTSVLQTLEILAVLHESSLFESIKQTISPNFSSVLVLLHTS